MMLHLNLTLFLIHRVSDIFLLLCISLFFKYSHRHRQRQRMFELWNFRFIFLIFFMDPSIDSDDLICDDTMEDERKWDSFSWIKTTYCFSILHSRHFDIIRHLWSKNNTTHFSAVLLCVNRIHKNLYLFISSLSPRQKVDYRYRNSY